MPFSITAFSVSHSHMARIPWHVKFTREAYSVVRVLLDGSVEVPSRIVVSSHSVNTHYPAGPWSKAGLMAEDDTRVQ